RFSRDWSSDVCSSDLAFFMLDTEGRVASWNPGAERIKGYRAEEILGQDFSRFHTPEDIAQGKPELGLRTATAEGRFEDEGWRVRDRKSGVEGKGGGDG